MGRTGRGDGDGSGGPRRRTLLAATLALAAAPARPAGTRPPAVHALLVAVGRVAALPRRLTLRGPDNDTALLQALLLERGVPAAHIARLGQRPGDMAPTRAVIGQALQDLAARAQPGDQVLLHLAGHGVQAPQRPGAPVEPDGLDEVFLAADTGAWDAATGVLPQGLYDHDLAAWMDSLAARGVRLLAVLDCCHAAGLQRGAAPAADHTRWRGVAAAELGVPPAPSRRAAAAAVSPLRPAAPPPGRVLALAARAHESTPEDWLPRGSPQARMQGVFSYAVAQALREGVQGAPSLRDSLARQYAEAGRASPVPMVLGESGFVLG